MLVGLHQVSVGYVYNIVMYANLHINAKELENVLN